MNKQSVIKKSPTSHQQHLINKPSKSNQQAINKFPFAPSAGIVALSLVNPVASAASAPISRTSSRSADSRSFCASLRWSHRYRYYASGICSSFSAPSTGVILEFLLRKAIRRRKQRHWEKEEYINPGVQRFEGTPKEPLAEITQAPTKRVRRRLSDWQGSRQ